MADEKVAVITGANAGIGLSLAERMLTEHPGLRLCLACRNQARAEIARSRLRQRHPVADISIIIIDTSCVKSVFQAAREIRSKYKRLDFLYLNAGMMEVKGLHWDQVPTIFSSDGPRILTTGHGILNQVDGLTDEGLQRVFATNLFGHFVLVRELEDEYGGETPTQLIWTSSTNADVNAFNLDDLQHRKGVSPYSSVKYITDLTSLALNERLNSRGIYSHVTSPGLVLTNLTYGILPFWAWLLLLPFFFLARLFVSTVCINPYNGSESLLWLARQKPASMDPMSKYSSNVTFFGSRYVSHEKMRWSTSDADSVYQQLDKLYQKFRSEESHIQNDA